MAVNPNDNRFFITLCNYLKKNSIEFETIEGPDLEFEDDFYSCHTDQLGVVEHNKENLMAAFDQIIQMFSLPYYKLFLYKFFFDVIDSETNLGQYSITYILINEKTEPTEPENTFTITEEEMTALSQVIPEPPAEAIEPDDVKTNEEEIINEEPEEPEFAVSEEKETADEFVNSEESEPVVSDCVQKSIPNIQSEMEKQPEKPKSHENVSISTREIDQNFFLVLQTDIDYLIKLLDKKINPEVSEVLSKAILIVFKNRLNIE